MNEFINAVVEIINRNPYGDDAEILCFTLAETEEEKEYVKKLFSTTDVLEIADMLGIKKS